jgi:hypothetical protein
VRENVGGLAGYGVSLAQGHGARVVNQQQGGLGQWVAVLVQALRPGQPCQDDKSRAEPE